MSCDCDNDGYEFWFWALLFFIICGGSFTCDNKAKGAEPNLWQLAPIRNIDTSSVYGDVAAHCPQGQEDRSSDIGTAAHETCHSVNAAMRNSTPGKECFYLLHNRCAVLDKTHHTTLADVAARIR